MCVILIVSILHTIYAKCIIYLKATSIHIHKEVIVSAIYEQAFFMSMKLLFHKHDKEQYISLFNITFPYLTCLTCSSAESGKLDQFIVSITLL